MLAALAVAAAPDAVEAVALAAAVDPLLRDPACLPCRQSLRAALWQAWNQPPARVLPRTAPDAMGQRYLDALERGPATRTTPHATPMKAQP